MGRPPPKHQQAQLVTFRRWLVERVAETAWVFNSTMNNQQLAQRLGVQTDVLVDARRFLDAFYRQRTEVLGMHPVRLNGQNHLRTVTVSRKAVFQLRAPQYLFGLWCRYAEERHLSRTDLLRSLIHLYLSQKDYPLTSQDWTYKGTRYEVWDSKNRWPWMIQCMLPYEVKTLFSVRAKLMGIAMSSIARSMVLDLLEGKITDLKLITNPTQFWSMDRYFRGDEAVRQATHLEIRQEGARAQERRRRAAKKRQKKEKSR